MENFKYPRIFVLILLFLPVQINASENRIETAIFAGGCFWSMQHDFENLPGVINTTVGYTGGDVANPTYGQVSTGTTGHYEAIKIVFNPKLVSYENLLDKYWHDTDPTDSEGQFCDKGNEYRPVIFYLNINQKSLAFSSKKALENSGKLDRVETAILPAKVFYPAEEYHQHYSDKNPVQYDAYRAGCQRDARRAKVWN